MMKTLTRLFAAGALLCASATVYAGPDKLYSITACPGEDASTEMNISWAADTSLKRSVVAYTEAKDVSLKKIRYARPLVEYCDLFKGIYSKNSKNEDFYQDVVFNKCGAALKGLKPDREYLYWVLPAEDSIAERGSLELSQARRFKTAGAKEWSICIISDFHAYDPLPKRLEAASAMIDKVIEYDNDIDWILHLGDVCAWGGSYSFWQNLYENKHFKNYMWAGVNGNHDNMSRKYELTNRYFKNAGFYPRNGYEGEEGVCYFFKYGNALFIMLNNENMREEEGLQAAQEWVRKVIAENPADYIIVCEHYQWFFGTDGSTSQYGRWSKLFDECGVDLALSGNNHIYVRTDALYNGSQTDGTKGTVYIQSPSSDNERGQAKVSGEVEHNSSIIEFRWNEGPCTVGGMHMSADKKKLTVKLLDREGNILDSVNVLAKKKN